MFVKNATTANDLIILIFSCFVRVFLFYYIEVKKIVKHIIKIIFYALTVSAKGTRDNNNMIIHIYGLIPEYPVCWTCF